MYKVEWKKEALKGLDKIDRAKAKKIKLEVDTVLAKDPYKKSKPLKGNLKGLRRFRFSDCRVIYQVKQSKLLIIVVEVAHRREIY